MNVFLLWVGRAHLWRMRSMHSSCEGLSDLVAVECKQFFFFWLGLMYNLLTQRTTRRATPICSLRLHGSASETGIWKRIQKGGKELYMRRIQLVPSITYSRIRAYVIVDVDSKFIISATRIRPLDDGVHCFAFANRAQGAASAFTLRACCWYSFSTLPHVGRVLIASKFINNTKQNRIISYMTMAETTYTSAQIKQAW